MPAKEIMKLINTSLRSTYQPRYPDTNKLEDILSTIASYPPILFAGEIENLKRQLAEAGTGKRFILQGGDCAERFIDCNEQAITDKMKILLQMSLMLTYGAKKPVIKIGRIAGQFAKPRTNSTEMYNGEEIFTYMGDSVNSFLPGIAERTPDPQRLLQSYYHSVITLNFIRSLIAGGFADLHHPRQWDLYPITGSKSWERFTATVERILDSISFMESFGGLRPESIGLTDFFISHEGLLLGYEEALTKKDPSSDRYYNLGSHMLWIGDRTRDINGAHVDYFSKIANPIGLKIGPTISVDEIIALTDKLNPDNEPGRLSLIVRLGRDKVEDRLPEILSGVKKSNRRVVWSCDPMHGNLRTVDGIKTRNFDNILDELSLSFRLHKEHGTILSGVHFELTGEDVTECTGGSINITDLSRNYESYCDPRLNYHQSLEMAFLISEFLK